MIRTARLRPWRFSSTTVVLASCRSDHFPKRPIYISDVRESDVRRGPGSHPFSNCLWATQRAAFLAPDRWPTLARGGASVHCRLGEMVGSSGGGHRGPVHRRRNIGHDAARNRVGLDTAAQRPVGLGPQCFISGSPPEVITLLEQSVIVCRGRAGCAGRAGGGVQSALHRFAAKRRGREGARAKAGEHRERES
jgi:hypothetical protein